VASKTLRLAVFSYASDDDHAVGVVDAEDKMRQEGPRYV
jgi:hypothetical protein